MAGPGTIAAHLESPRPDGVLPPGRHWLQGWAVAPAGDLVVDVRARAGGQVFAGIHGHPRPDLAAHFAPNQETRCAGFTVPVRLEPGRQALVVEAQLLDGTWWPCLQVDLTVGSGERVDFALPGTAVRWHEYGRLLDSLAAAVAAAPGDALDTLADREAASFPEPHELLQPPSPFRGYLDEPAAFARCVFGRTPLLGWLAHERGVPIRRVLATVDLQAWHPLEHDRPSATIAAHFPDLPGAERCGLFGLVDVPTQLPSPVTLRLYAELEDGTLHLVAARRSRVRNNDAEKAPYPARDRLDFDRLQDAAHRALARRGLPLVAGPELDREIDRRREEFARRSPVAPRPEPPPRSAPDQADGAPPRSVLFVSHSLDLEGAPLFLLDLVRAHAASGSAVTVVSPTDGPLRQVFAAEGVAVRTVDIRAVFTAADEDGVQSALADVARALDVRAWDLVIANTFTTFWAVHAAAAAGRPVLLYVHESSTPAHFYGGRMSAAVIAAAERAFALATGVAFTTASTRRYHLGYGRPERHWLVPGWIDVARLARWRETQSRDECRRRLGVGPGELLVSNIGTISDRKGQHAFARAVDLLWRRHPDLAQRTRFLLLGGRRTAFDTLLGQLLAELRRPNLLVHPETSDYLPYFLAADVFACSSFEESSPRVVLEAMALGAPILASGVHGIPEMVRDGREAVLLPPGDTVAWCGGLARLLRDPAERASLRHAADQRVVAEFAADRLLPRHLAMAASVARTT